MVPEPEITEEERAAQERARACSQALGEPTASNVLFATSSAALSRDAHQLLDAVATAAGSCDTFSLRLAGHADPRGDEASNQRLSERRAAAVQQYLVGQGVAADALSAAGLGETRSLGGDLAADRRVEITVGG